MTTYQRYADIYKKRQPSNERKTPSKTADEIKQKVAELADVMPRPDLTGPQD